MRGRRRRTVKDGLLEFGQGLSLNVRGGKGVNVGIEECSLIGEAVHLGGYGEEEG